MDRSQLFKVPLKYGVAGGIISLLLFITLYFLDESPLSAIRLFDFVLIPLFVFFSLKEFRDYKNEGKMAYWEGMTVGLVCYGLIALISASAILLFLEVIDPQLFVQHKQENITILTQDPQEWVEQLGREDYEEALEDVRGITPVSLAADDFVKKILIGLFLTSVISIFLKRT